MSTLEKSSKLGIDFLSRIQQISIIADIRVIEIARLNKII